jgi:hypothetical protein
MVEDITAKVKAIVTLGVKAKFDKYFDGQLWYTVFTKEVDGHSDAICNFPVPISDIGTATFLAEDKPLLFMRYIRKHLQMLEDAKDADQKCCHGVYSWDCALHMDGHN